MKNAPFLHIIKLDTHGVHLQKKIVKKRSSSKYYKVRHPRGASIEEDRQERLSSTYYHVRHPRGASIEDDREERSSSTYYKVRHPQGAPTEEDHQETLIF